MIAGHFGGNRVQDIVRTNAFGTMFGGEEKLRIVKLPSIQRLNHDCRPKQVMLLLEKKRKGANWFAVRASHLIPRLSLSKSMLPDPYIQEKSRRFLVDIDEKKPFAERQKHIHAHWGFHCMCSDCSISENRQNISEERISRIKDMRKSLLGFSSKASKGSCRQMAQELIHLYKEGRLHSVMAEGEPLEVLFPIQAHFAS
ncbi:hypothetical protein LSUE1_G000093 [Lachnellula suecica]|uniref:SET domain-containing protein n=1 Tax=Lachnellula suecica TaxID=602035 RepID=A0A8T9CIA0_9HELO|nr:hypothetical protein LSUE1_G000093 [Lachnellula suecica]